MLDFLLKNWKDCILMYDKSRHMLKIRIPTIQTRLLFMWFCELFVLTVVRFVLSRMGIYEGLTRSLILTAVASVPVIILLFQMIIKKIRDWYPFLWCASRQVDN